MHRALLSSVLLVACAAPEAPSVDSPGASEFVVRVLDVTGRPVEGAEVLALRTVIEPGQVSEFLLLGYLGQVEEFGVAHPTDARGEARIAAGAGPETLIARDEGRFGALRVDSRRERDISITIEPDETQTIVCADADGKGGVGALVWIDDRVEDAEDALRDQLGWSGCVRRADGVLELPHAQYWRARARSGGDVSIWAFVLWGDEMELNASISFPSEGDEPPRFEVSRGGFLDVRADGFAAETGGMLRWLDPAPDAEEPDDVPEFPFTLARLGCVAVPLDRQYEVVLSVPGFVDPRVTVAGPKSRGERVTALIERADMAVRVTGRLVDETGVPLDEFGIDVWLERGGIEERSEEDWLATRGGEFEFDLIPGSGGVLNFKVHALHASGEWAQEELVGTHRFASLEPGRVEIGDVVCSRAP